MYVYPSFHAHLYKPSIVIPVNAHVRRLILRVYLVSFGTQLLANVSALFNTHVHPISFGVQLVVPVFVSNNLHANILKYGILRSAHVNVLLVLVIRPVHAILVLNALKVKHLPMLKHACVNLSTMRYAPIT